VKNNSILKPNNKEIISHINGEIDMFIWCYERIRHKIDKLDGHEKRMVHECFLLHARNLTDFLWKEKSKYSDDVLAVNFLVKDITKPRCQEFKKIRKRIDKQLSHITFNRLSDKQIDLLPKTEKIYEIIMNGLKEYNSKARTEYKIELKI